MNLNQVTVPSRNVAPSIAFYELLGLELIVHTHDKYARFQCPKGDATFSVEWAETPIQADAKVYFEVSDLDAEYDRLKNAGVHFDQVPTDQPWLWREAYLRDPYGNRIILYTAGENRKSPPWKKVLI